jgi:uncharacterized damage-inducible protein DinB
MDLKPMATGLIKNSCRMFLSDLQALPAETFDKPLGGSARTVADLVFEVNLVNDHICMVLRGEEPFEWPDAGWIKAPEGFASKEDVLAAYEKSSQQVMATVDGLSSEALEGTVQTEHGDRTRFERCTFMALHQWYHSGQLNFIQTLKGDDAFHW